MIKVVTSRGYEFLFGDKIKDMPIKVFNRQNQQIEYVSPSKLNLNNHNICLPLTSSNKKKKYIELKPALVPDVNGRLNTKIRQPKTLNEDLAYLIGYSKADGYFRKENWKLSLACANKYPQTKEKIEAITKKCFLYEIKIKEGVGDLENYNLYSKIVINFLKKNDLLKEKAESITFPDLIKKSPTSVQVAFIAGFFDGDGSCSAGVKKGYSFASVAKSFLKDLQDCLLSMGIISRLHHEERESIGLQNLYILTVNGSVSQQKFVELFLNHSIKVQLNNFVAKKDKILTPYKAKDFNIPYNKYSYLNSRDNLSIASYQKLLAEGKHNLPKTIIWMDEIKEISLGE